jgi:hypothetical protein
MLPIAAHDFDLFVKMINDKSMLNWRFAGKIYADILCG